MYCSIHLDLQNICCFVFFVTLVVIIIITTVVLISTIQYRLRPMPYTNQHIRCKSANVVLFRVI